ncbi:MAG: peptide-binding protein [Brevinematales bacterium]|nr:peptide-binding protein [Brevinematales bacterium]
MRFINLLLILLLVFIVSCSRPNLKNEETIVLTLSQEPQTFNPVSSLDLYSSTIISFIYDSLFEVDQNLNFVPKIVKEYSVSSDSKVFRFRLREDAKWQDGTPITADDIIYTFSMITNPISKAFNKVAQYKDVEYVKKIDSLTFEVKYKQPYAPALESWAMTPIPKHIFEKEDFHNTKYNSFPIGSGAYEVKKVVPGQYIILEKTTNYWDKNNEPNIKKIVFRIIKDPTVEFNALKVGETDLAGIRPIDWINQVEQDWFKTKFNSFKYYTLNISQIALNLRNEILSDKLVRKALAHAINKEEIKNNVYFGLAEPLSGPFPPNSWAYNPNVDDYEFSLDKSIEYLEKAGWKDTDGDGIRDKNGKKLSLELIIPQGSETGIKIGEIFKETLKKIGVELNVRIMEWSMVTKTIDSRTFEMVMFGWSLSIDPDPYDIWHSSQIKGGINYVSYSNPEVDKLCEIGRKIFNREERKKIYSKIHKIINDDLPYLFLFSRASLVGADKRVSNIDPSTAGIYWNFNTWKLITPQ